MDLFKSQSSYPKNEAQANLMGRTHYVDDATLKWHHSRILETHICDSGLIFALIESMSLDMNNTRRGYRPVVFDVFGTVISRPQLADSFSTKRAAVNAMWKIVNSIDAAQLTREAADRSAERYVQEMVALKQTVDALEAGNKLHKPAA